MINYDSLTLKAQLRELSPILAEGRVQKVQQPTRKDLLLNIRALGKNHKLYISIDPKYPHLCLLTSESEKYRLLEIPSKPPMFCMLLRKHLEGAKIQAVNQPENERIFEIYFESYNELGERVPLVLAIELMGKHSNIVLYNYDNNVIIGCAHNIGAEKSREREMAGGLPYIYPPKAKKYDLNQITGEEFFNLTKALTQPLNIFLNQKFHNISLALANELCEFAGILIEQNSITSAKKETILRLYSVALNAVGLKDIHPSISEDYSSFSLFSLKQTPKNIVKKLVNSMVDEYFAYHSYQDNFLRLKNSLLSITNKELKKEERRLEKQTYSEDTVQKAEKYKIFGDLIMSNLYKIQQGEEKILIENFYDDMKIIEIPLETTLSGSENAQRYYKLYTKSKNAMKIALEMKVAILEQINYLNSIKTSLELSCEITDLTQIKEELVSENLIKSSIETKPKKKTNSIIDIDKKEINGFSIFIGKNNKQNDYIVSKLASPEDIWIHAQEIPGSHVLIKIPPDKKDIPDEIIYEGMKLAAQYSQAQGAPKTAVIYTKKKFLKKPPCAKPGYVTYSHEKVVITE